MVSHREEGVRRSDDESVKLDDVGVRSVSKTTNTSVKGVVNTPVEILLAYNSAKTLCPSPRRDLRSGRERITTHLNSCHNDRTRALEVGFFDL